MSHLRLVHTCRASGGANQVPPHRACLEAFQQEFDYLGRALRRLGVHFADVEDVAHDVFLVLHRHWGEYDRARPLRPHLFGIAYRVAATYHGQKRHRPYAVLEGEEPALRPDQALDAKRARAIVLRALLAIPLPRRAVFIMHAVDEATMHEVTSALQIPLFTAYSRLRKARKEFEAELRRPFERSGR